MMCTCAMGCDRNPMADPGVFPPCRCWCHKDSIYAPSLPTGRRAYGWAVTHLDGAGNPVHLVWDDDTHPEMTPGEQRYRAVMLALHLIYDGSCWPDQVTVTHLVGSHGSFRHVGTSAIERLAEDYDLKHHEPGYWESLRDLVV